MSPMTRQFRGQAYTLFEICVFLAYHPMATEELARMGMGRANSLGRAVGGCGAPGQCGLFHGHIGLVVTAYVNGFAP